MSRIYIHTSKINNSYQIQIWAEFTCGGCGGGINCVGQFWMSWSVICWQIEHRCCPDVDGWGLFVGNFSLKAVAIWLPKF